MGHKEQGGVQAESRFPDAWTEKQVFRRKSGGAQVGACLVGASVEYQGEMGVREAGP